MQAGEEDYELKQMRDMAAAKKRWDTMVFHKISCHCINFPSWLLLRSCVFCFVVNAVQVFICLFSLFNYVAQGRKSKGTYT